MLKGRLFFMLVISLGVIILIILIFMKVNVIIAAPVSLVLVSFMKDFDPLEVLTGEYVQGVSFFIEDFLFIFLLGAILGKIISLSGAAETIANYTIYLLGPNKGVPAVLLTSALLAYGGIPGFVLVFSIYPISFHIFREANLSKKFLPACFHGGMANFALFMPGSPQVHNIIPMDTLGTSPIAGLVPGIAGAATASLMALVYLMYRSRYSQLKGEVFEEDKNFTPTINAQAKANNKPGIVAATLPLLIVVGSLSLLGISVILALTLGIIFGIFLLRDYLSSILSTVNVGIKDSLMPLLFAASAVGFGLTLRAFPAFDVFLQGTFDLSLNPLITASIVTNIGAAIMGSASGGIVLTMSFAGENFMSYADPEVLHRIIVMASSCIDTVPFNNGYLAILAITGLSIKKTYLDFFVTTVITPILGLGTALIILLI